MNPMSTVTCTRALSLSNVNREELEQYDNIKRPRSAPSSPNAGRKLLPSRLRSSRPQKRFHYGTSKTQMKLKSGRSRTMSRPSTMASSRDPAAHTQRPQSVTVIRTPAYSLCRSPTSVQMNINANVFFGDKQEEATQISSKKSSPTASAILGASYAAAMEKAVLAEQALQAEIAEMHIKLEDEKEHHRNQLTQLESNFEKEKIRIAKVHEINISEIKGDHEREMGVLHHHYAEQITKVLVIKKEHQSVFETSKQKETDIISLKQELQHQHELVVADFQKKLEFAKEELETTKITLVQEAEEKLEHREEELKELHSSELQEVEFTMKEEGKRRLAELRRELNDKHHEEMEEMKKEHEEEVKVLISQFNEMQKLEKKLAQSNKQVKKLEKETSKLKAKLKQAHSEQLETEAKLFETKQRLEQFESNYQDNVKAVQGSYKDRLDSLMQENAELRRRLMHHADQFCTYKATVEKQQTQTLRQFKDKVQVVVRAREKAHLSVATNMDGDEEQCEEIKRPSSAPMTKRESSRARQQVRARTVMQGHKTEPSLQARKTSRNTVFVHKQK